MTGPTYKCPKCGSSQVAVDATSDYLVNPNTGDAYDGTGGDIIWTPDGFIQCRECDASADEAAEWLRLGRPGPAYTFQRRALDTGAHPDDITRDALLDCLIDWVVDPAAAVAELERTAPAWNALKPFMKYRALETVK